MNARLAARIIGLMFVVSGSALLLACGGGDGGASTNSGTSSKTSASSPDAADGKVNVTLSEWAAKPSRASARAGKVEFKVTNSGTTPHEFVIVKTDVAQDKLEQASGIVDEAKYKPLVRSKQINGAESVELEAELTPGKYVLLCNISGHYGLGMHAAFTAS